MSQVVVGYEPANMVCPSCGETVVTRVARKPSVKTHLMALFLFVCLCCVCVFLPYCIPACQDAAHYCPNCDAYIGSYQL